MAPNEHQSPPIPSNDVQQRGSGPIEESECAQKTDAQRGGLEGLSQEELDELAADPEADMDG
jgi:hypothetical protein